MRPRRRLGAVGHLNLPTVGLHRPAGVDPSSTRGGSAAAAALAQWKPTTSACVGEPPADDVLLAASVDSAASPSAPPICWDVLKSPEARPWSSSSRPVVAIKVNGMKTAPMPSEEIRIAG